METKQQQEKVFCSTCQCEDSDENPVSFTTNPYNVEICNDFREDWYCARCLCRSAEDV